MEAERRFLGLLPRRRFDTAYVADHRVHPKLPFVAWDAVSYSVEPHCRGQKVTCRVEVDTDVLEVRWGTDFVARHRLAPGSVEPVWDPAHRAAAEAIALGRSRLPLRLVTPSSTASEGASAQDGPSAPLELGDGDYAVDAL